MSLLEQKIISTLTELKENHGVTAVKAEFEAEGSSYEEVRYLKSIADEAGLELTIKTGGCEAVTDMLKAKELCASTIVAPMIETPYAMKKFVNAVNLVFSEQERKNIKFLINVETITGFNNLEDIIRTNEFSQLDGIVLGRADMTASMGLSKSSVDSEQIKNIAHQMSVKMMDLNKDFVVGGGVTDKSLVFFKNLPYLTKFETRKIIFDSAKALTNNNNDKIISKAIEFELMWLKNKNELFGTQFKGDEIRIKMLEEIFNHNIEKTL